MSRFGKLLCAAVAALCLLPARAAEWMTDLDAACRRAAAEGKAVLVDFTGSDWCPWCVRLRQSVLDTPAFAAYAQDKFVLVEVDVPLAELADPHADTPRRRLCERYGVDAFPAVYVLTPQGELVGGFEGSRDSLAAIRPLLDAAAENNRALKAAAALEGDARAQAIRAVIARMPDELRYKAGQPELPPPADNETP